MDQNMRIYQNLKQINIITFWEIAESENYVLMDIDHSDDKTYSDIQLLEMQSDFMQLYDDYFSYKDDSRQRNTLSDNDKHVKEAFKLTILNEQYKTLQLLEFNKESLKTNDFVEMVNDVYSQILQTEKRIRINRIDSLERNADKLKRVIEALNQKLLLNEKRSKQEVSKEANKFRNHYENISGIEQVLERSIGDVSKINALQWLAYEKEAEKIIKIKKQNGGRKSHN